MTVSGGTCSRSRSCSTGIAACNRAARREGFRIESLDAGWPPEQVSLAAAIGQASRALQQHRLLLGERDLFLALPIFPEELQADTQADTQADMQGPIEPRPEPHVELRSRAPAQAPRQ